jgi:cytochrome c oxidase subunit II
MKLDAIPGRINHGLLYILREGVFYGQCSELCGQGHSYMPIVVQGVNNYSYIN